MPLSWANYLALWHGSSEDGRFAMLTVAAVQKFVPAETANTQLQRSVPMRGLHSALQ